MNILIVNQYAPPDPSPTARLAGDLRTWFEEQGHSVRILGEQDYYRRAHGALRWKRELGAHARLLREGLLCPQADVVLVFSSPPMLLVTGSWIAAWHGARLIHWALDLYPDLAWALGEFNSTEGFALCHGMMKRCLAKCDPVVAVASEMRPYLAGHYGVEAEVIEPWPQEPTVYGQVDPVVDGAHWLYSGNLGRAHEFQTMLRAQQLLEERGVEASLVIQGDGQARSQARTLAEALGLKRVVWSGYMEAERLPSALAAADVLVATQKNETNGMLWPSKLALASCVSRKVLWIGPERSAQRDGVIAFRPGQEDAIADWLEKNFRRRDESLSLEQGMMKIRHAREAGRDGWLKLLQGIG